MFLLFGREDSHEILVSLWQDEETFEVLKPCYIQIYPTIFLLCYGKAVNLLHNIYVNFRVEKFEVLVKETAEHSLVSDIKRDGIPKFDTYFTQTEGTFDKNT